MKKKTLKSYVAITVLILTMVLVAITYLFASALFSELGIARSNKGSQVAFAMAEAAVQHAIYQVKFDPVIKSDFVNGNTTCCTTVTQNPALIGNGSFEQTISVTGPGLADITAIGRFTMGSRTAVRSIKTSIAQSVTPPSYDDDAAIFVSRSGSSDPGSLYTNQSTIKVYGGGVLSGGELEFKNSALPGNYVHAEGSIEYSISDESNNSSIKCQCYIDTAPDPQTDPPTPQCSAAPSCTPSNVINVDSIPSIDIDSADPNSYKNRAAAESQYFDTANSFKNYLSSHSNTISGIVYVNVGSSGTLDFGTLVGNNQTVTVNGILVSSYNILVPNNRGLMINLNPTAGGPSGIIAKHDFKVANGAAFSGSGMFYAGNLIETNHPVFNVTGGIFARDIIINQGNLTINFDKDLINQALPPNPADTPIIQRQYWEEEY